MILLLTSRTQSLPTDRCLLCCFDKKPEKRGPRPLFTFKHLKKDTIPCLEIYKQITVLLPGGQKTAFCTRLFSGFVQASSFGVWVLFISLFVCLSVHLLPGWERVMISSICQKYFIFCFQKFHPVGSDCLYMGFTCR